MKISPRYDAEPIIAIDGPVDDLREPFVCQRRRLEGLLGALTNEQWRTPSRCDGWTVQDVIAHLVGTNDFWTLSITSALAGSPTRFLDGFDPKATPAAMVDGMQSMTPAETFARFVASNDGLCDAVASLDGAGWTTIAEAPPGHLPIRLIAHHALWDAWVHERDILLPLGMEPTEEPDEIVASLRYCAALGPAFALSSQPDRVGAIVLDVTEPVAHVVVEVDGVVRVHGGVSPDGALVLRGRAVDLVEALSIRRPFDQQVATESAWLLAGLAEVFETA